MRKEAVITLFAILLISNALSIENDSIGPDEIQTGEPAVCGDNICQDVEAGVCPQDCQENSSKKAENTGETEKTKESIRGLVTSNINQITVISAVSGIIILLTIITVRKLQEDETGDSKLNNWVQKQLEEGYSEKEIRMLLEEQGYSDSKIREVINQNR